MAETPMPAKAGKPKVVGTRMEVSLPELRSIRCSLALGFLTHEAQMVFRESEKGAMPYFSKYHMPSRHFGLNPASVRLGTWLLQQTANSFCVQCMPKTAVSGKYTFCQIILVIPGTKRRFPMPSHPASASRFGSNRKS